MKRFWTIIRYLTAQSALAAIFHLSRFFPFSHFPDFCLGAAFRVRKSCAHMVLWRSLCKSRLGVNRPCAVPWRLMWISAVTLLALGQPDSPQQDKARPRTGPP